MNKSEIAERAAREPQQFIKRPIPVVALQFAEDGSNWAQVHAFMGRQCPLNVPTFYAEVHTLEGMLMAKRGWWIIRGIEGEFYPCEPGIFVKTYERVERAIAELKAAPYQDFTLIEINPMCLKAGIASPHWNALEKQLARELLRWIPSRRKNRR